MSADKTRLVRAEKHLDTEGKAQTFLLKNGPEEVRLEPGKVWNQLDVFKWVQRGIIDDPSGFHVLPNGSVQIHGEQIEIEEESALVRLEQAINRRVAAPGPKPVPVRTSSSLSQDHARDGKVRFKVRLDKLGHLTVTALNGGEKTETGIRGLETLVRNGLMLKPRSVHLDPLLRFVELDDARFESDAAGAEALEQRLNASYAPILKEDHSAAIEIRPNTAAPSGFDIHFFTVRAGARFEVKGHLSQANLDLLQDQSKCQLLNRGIVLRISPPHLIIRRRRHDGIEERSPNCRTCITCESQRLNSSES